MAILAMGLRFRRTIQRAARLLALLSSLAVAQADSSRAVRQSLNDAWWTGPMLAPSAATLPRGHFLVEPYLYDVRVQGFYDSSGSRRPAPHANDFGSLTYMNYGLSDKLTVGLIPIFGYNQVSSGLNSGGIRVGDLTLQAQYGLTKFREGRRMPTTAIAIQETLPTGQFDRLGDRASGLGAGAYTTTLAFYCQTYFWMRNGRILRMRFNVAPAFSSNVNVKDASVYGTANGFRGRAKPGSSLFLDAAWEYSLTRQWVIALDATYRHQANTFVSGSNVVTIPVTAIRLNSGTSDALGLAPAIEYNCNRQLGVLVGVRLIPAGRNTSATITPAVAINFVH
jgi:hypothetical protein